MCKKCYSKNQWIGDNVIVLSRVTTHIDREWNSSQQPIVVGHTIDVRWWVCCIHVLLLQSKNTYGQFQKS